MSVRTPVRSDATLGRPVVPEAGTVESKPPVYWWALAGALLVAFEGYSVARWIISGQAKPTPLGSDPVPSWVKVSVIINQAVMVAVLVCALTWVIRGCVRQKRFTFDACVTVAWWTAWFWDPTMNWFRPQIFYNSYTVNLGSWTSSIPGWVSPNAHRVPEPILFTGSVYGWMVLTAVLGCNGMRWAKRRWPRLTGVQLSVIAYVVMAAFCFAVEVVWIRTRVYSYGGLKGLTVFWGKPYQYPAYSAILFGTTMAVPAILRYFLDDRGYSYVERGIDRLSVRGHRRSAVRALAVTGAVHVAFILGYVVPMQFFTAHDSHFPKQPSYMRDFQCGPGTAYWCPGSKHAPIYIRGQNPTDYSTAPSQ
jgi:Spirocyclase AveC-like